MSSPASQQQEQEGESFKHDMMSDSQASESSMLSIIPGKTEDFHMEKQSSPDQVVPDSNSMWEDNGSHSNSDSVEPDERPGLTSLPPEVFLTICSYLPATFILTTLSLVCRAFRDLLQDDSTWKIRISKRCQKLYPRIPALVFNWKAACMAREEALHVWCDPERRLDVYSLQKNVNAAVDAVHLMDHGNLLASGSRDRHLILWDLKKLDPWNADCEDQVKLLTKMNAHEGWIWSIASRQHFVATGSWDATVKIWDVGPDCEEIRRVKCRSAMLCVDYVGQTIVAGGYDKHTYMIDSRTGAITHRRRHHRRSVLCLAADQDYVITGSEDRTLCIFDQRAGKIYKTITLEHFPMCLSYYQNQLLAGDKTGQVVLIDASHGRFDPVKVYDVGHEGRVTGVVNGYGCTITSSVDRTIRVLEPCDSPACLRQIKTHSQDVAGIDYQEGTLVSAGSDCQIGVWRPKQFKSN